MEKKADSMHWMKQYVLFGLSSLLVFGLGCHHSKTNNGPAPDHNTDTTAYYTLRILSFNIQHGMTTDGQIDLERYAEIINAQKPDLVALVEIDSVVKRSGNVNQTAVLAEQTGMQGYFGRFRSYQNGSYGDALLSRLPVSAFTVIQADSKADSAHARSYLFADVQLNDSVSISFNCSHLTPYVEAQKTVQAEELRAYYRAELKKSPLLICGDLNAIPTSDAIKTLCTDFAPSDPYFQPTFNARKSLTKKIDYILYPKTGSWKVIDFKRILEKDASDHCAILSVLRYEPD